MRIARFQVEGQVFVYDPHTNLLLKCDPMFADAAEMLRLRQWDGLRLEDVELELSRRLGEGSLPHVRTAARLWYFLGAFRAGGHNVRHFPRRAELANGQGQVCSLSSLTLCVTDDCNLRCSYCSYSGNYECSKVLSGRSMALDTALAAIDYFAAHSQEREKVFYSFYGGEPLLAWPVIQECLARIRQRESGCGREHYVTMTTNGTLLTEDVTARLAEANVFVTVSLDGPASIHDQHRRSLGGQGTFERVKANLERLRASRPGYYKSNVSFSTVMSEPAHIREANSFFTQGPGGAHPAEHFQVSFVAARNAKPDFADRLERQMRGAGLADLADEYVEAASDGRLEDWKLTDAYYKGKMENKILRRRLSLRGEPFRPGNQCVIGLHSLFVSADGGFYPCSALEQQDYRLGDVGKGIELQRVEAILGDYEEMMFGRCGSCWAARQCRLCLANFTGACARSREALDAQCDAQRESLLEMMSIHCRILLRRGAEFRCHEEHGRPVFPDVIDAGAVEEGLAHLGVVFDDERLPEE